MYKSRPTHDQCKRMKWMWSIVIYRRYDENILIIFIVVVVAFECDIFWRLMFLTIRQVCIANPRTKKNLRKQIQIWFEIACSESELFSFFLFLFSCHVVHNNHKAFNTYFSSLSEHKKKKKLATTQNYEDKV